MFVIHDLARRIRWAFIALTFLLLHGNSRLATAAQDQQVEANLRLGAQAMHSGKAEQAEKYFREVTQIAPKLADGYLDMGLAQLRQNKFGDAADSLQKALQLNPNAPGAQMFLGITYYQMNRLDEARAALQRENALQPNNAEVLMWLGITELAARNPENAVAPLDKAAELSPKDINILDYRGRAHLLVSKDSYARMYALDPNSWRMHRLSAQIYSESNQHKDSIREYEAAIKLAPQQADLYEELGDEYRKDSNLDLAAATYRKELELTPRNAVAMYNLGSVLVEQGKARDGVPLLEAAVKIFSKPSVADYYLGRGLADVGRYEEAADHLEKATRVEPQNEAVQRAYYHLAQVYRKLQRPADARNAIAEFQKLADQRAQQGAKEVADWKKLNSDAPAETSLPAPRQP